MSHSLLVQDRRSALTVPTEILRCPVTRGPLHELSHVELDALNARIADGRMRHLDGSTVEEPCQVALQTADRSLVYRVHDDIAVLLPALAMVPEESLHEHQAYGMSDDKRAVQDFYEAVGWNQGKTGEFVDAELWEDRRPVSRDYIRKCHQRVARHVKPAGRYLLDVASGPIQYDEYLTYSEHYAARICVDISLAALREARRKLGPRGIYILGDITNLPLRDGMVDGAVSLHTIYHVPADEQAAAFDEIFRVLRPGCTAAIVYCWRSGLIKALGLPAKLARWPLRMLRKMVAALLGRSATNRRPDARSAHTPQEKLYYHAHPYSWFARQAFGFPAEVRTWRSISVPLMRAYVHRWLFGRALLAVLYFVEEHLPHACGRFGAYPLIVIYKP